MSYFNFKYHLFIVGILLLLAIPQHLSAQVTVSNMFTNGMVLQQNSDVNLWGWANPGDTIAVTGSWNNKTVKTATAATKKWILKLSTPAAKTDGTSYTITIKGANTILLKDVLIGEVWLLSGQSNMEMQLEGWTGAPVEGSAQAIAAANYPHIRLLIAGKKSSALPMANMEKNWTTSAWTACSPASAKSFSAVGYFFGKELFAQLKIPIGLVLSAWGGSSCETWANPTSLQLVTDFKNKGPWTPTKTDDNFTPTVLYNGMIAPVVPFTFAGVLWYQGETNVGRAQQLTELFPAMIEGWRNDFKQELPFYFVQLAPFGGYGGALPETWEAQAYAQKLKNTGMAGTLDLGDAANIHPAKKEPIGHRLALLALAKNYGQPNLVFSGPQYKSMQIEANKIRLNFDYSGSGLKAENNAPNQFEIAGDNLVFSPAKTLIDGHTLLVWNDQISSPKQVRYAWADAASASLYNNEGLPATPFRTNMPAYIHPVKASVQIGSKAIIRGETCRIDWTSFGASEVSLNGELIPINGSLELKPDITTIYTFIAKGESMSVTKSFTVVVNSGIQSAYPNGVPVLIPGIINPTYYDEGGEGVSYHDLTANNDGDGIRKEQGVDTEFRLPEGTIGGIASGEWLEFTVDVLQDGNYTFEILFATAGRYGKFHIELDGVDKTGQVSVASTGSYSNFSAKTVSGIALKKGVQVMRIYFDYAEYNLGTITVTREIPSETTELEKQKKLTVFPTPTHDKLYLSGIEYFYRYSILSVIGQVLKQGRIAENQTLDVKFLSAGKYLIRFEGDKRVQTEKIIKL
ncbi:MAG: sialate O-acetylesterase [Bacteroidota bacterium]|nr:sialate O-acetylesterase [Bacteroidota bacterium]